MNNRPLYVPDDPALAAEWMVRGIEAAAPVIDGDHERMATAFAVLYEFVLEHLSQKKAAALTSEVTKLLTQERQYRPWLQQVALSEAKPIPSA